MKSKLIVVVVFFTLFLCLLTANQAGATNYTLTLVAQGSGTIYRNPTNTTYPSGVTVTINGVANPGWYFANWTGDTNSSLNPLNVTMTGNLVVTGSFLAYPTYSLALVTNGQGGIVLSPPGGSYLSNTVVTATATAAAGWVFTGWSGATNSGVNPTSFAINTNGTLTGTFAQLPAFDVQPVSVTNKAGSTVNFASHSVGTDPVGYQWYFSGGSLTTITTNSTLSLTNVNTGQAGTYWAVATNNYGSATSQMVALTLTNSVGPTNVVTLATQASLQAAIALGGWVGIGFNGTLTLTNTIAITNNVVLDGSGVTATISGGNAVRLFYVTSGGTLMISNLTLANGYYLVTTGPSGTAADAGGIYNNGGHVVLVGCVMTNDAASAQIFGGVARGGAIFNNGGTVSLFASSFFSNNVVGGLDSSDDIFNPGFGFGGAVCTTNGSVNMVNCVLVGNTCISGSDYASAGSGSYGGALFGVSSAITLAGNTFSMNQAKGDAGMGAPASAGTANPAYGGAGCFFGGSLLIDHCQFLTNLAAGGYAGYHSLAGTAYGGGVYCAGTSTMIDSSFSGNQAITGNGTYSFGYLNNKGPTGFGGGIFNTGMLMLARCSVCSNYVQGGNNFPPGGSAAEGGDGVGGGIYNAAQLYATNCTIALNSAAGNSGGGYYTSYFGTNGAGMGGGVFNNVGATFVAMNLTIASNSCSSPPPLVQANFLSTNGIITGSQIANTNGTLLLHNTLLASSDNNINAYGPITDGGYNICSDGSANLFSGSSYNYTDSQLAPLGNYGGPTPCMALLASSPAVDNGDIHGCPSTDQRDYVRPFGSGPDMGAYEYGSVPLVLPYLGINPSGTNIVLSFTASLPYSYYLQCSTNLATWINLSTNGPVTVSTNITRTVNRQGLKQCFFRLLVQ